MLVPDEYILSGVIWLPQRVTAANLAKIANTNSVSAIFGEDGRTCESITFMSLIKIERALRVDMWTYGSLATSASVLAHIFYWLKYIRARLAPEVMMLITHFPHHVSAAEVTHELSSRLGAPVVSPYFDADEAICVVRELPRPSKL